MTRNVLLILLCAACTAPEPSHDRQVAGVPPTAAPPREVRAPRAGSNLRRARPSAAAVDTAIWKAEIARTVRMWRTDPAVPRFAEIDSVTPIPGSVDEWCVTTAGARSAVNNSRMHHLRVLLARAAPLHPDDTTGTAVHLIQSNPSGVAALLVSADYGMDPSVCEGR
jgi:hypothetical protein